MELKIKTNNYYTKNMNKWHSFNATKSYVAKNIKDLYIAKFD